MDIKLQSGPGPMASAISNVVDSKGVDVPSGTTTADTVLTLSGSGTVNSVVFIYDNGALLTPASVTINGTWSFTKTVALGRHEFTVRDSLGGVDSVGWVVTVGGAELDLQEPVVTQAPGGILNPMNAINGATVVVTYAMQTTDTIGISWNGQDNLVPTQPGSTLGSVTFTIPASALAPVIGKTIEVRYGVLRNGASKPSNALDLTVQTLPDAALEAPRILQATGDGSLDVSALTGDADLRVKPWPFIAAGQLISLRLEGTKADGSAHNWLHWSWQNLPISSTGEPSTTLRLNNLKTLKDGSSLTLIFDVSFDGGLTKVLFPIRTLNVHQLIAGFEDFESEQPTVLQVGVPFTCHSGLVLNLLMSRPIYSFRRTEIVRSSSPFEMGYGWVNHAQLGLLEFRLTGPSRFVDFDVHSVNGRGGSLGTYYNAAGRVVGSRPIPVTGATNLGRVSFVAPAGELVVSFQVDVKGEEVGLNDGGYAIDHIRWSA